MTEASAGAVEPDVSDGEVRLVFWHHGRHGGSSSTRSIAIESWAAIAKNYSGAVSTALEQMMALDPSRLRGRLLLLHGPPGTGKTTALRALGHAWRGWCDLEYVLDPEYLLRDPAYLTRFCCRRPMTIPIRLSRGGGC